MIVSTNELKFVECLSVIIINQYVKKVGHFCPSMDVMPVYREIYESKFQPFYIEGCLCPGRILGIINQDPSVSKTNRLHVDICHFFFVKLRNILYVPTKKPNWGKVLLFSLKWELLHLELLVFNVYFLHKFQYHHFILVHTWHKLAIFSKFPFII